MSSRNVYLSPEQRVAARVLSRALHAAEAAYGEGERDASKLRALIEAAIAAEPLAAIDYVSVADPDTLDELDGAVGRGAGVGRGALRRDAPHR